MSKVAVSLEEIWAMQKRRQEVNHLDLDDITFTYQGKEIKIPQEFIDEFRLCGLSDIDLITSSFLDSRGYKIPHLVDES